MNSKASPSPAPDQPAGVVDRGRGRTIGVFDSGVGGLSVLRALLQELPQADFVYAADRAFSPYGEKAPEAVTDRVVRIAEALRSEHGADMLVLACNTATAMAVDRLRAAHPDWPIVGVEPALKPAAQLSHSGHIGVLATRGTVQSLRFEQLCQRVRADSPRALHIHIQACDGLADAIEREDAQRTRALCQQYLGGLTRAAALDNAPEQAPMDTLVLGCTHYPFASAVLQELVGPEVTLIESGPAVARRARQVLPAAPAHSNGTQDPGLVLLCTAAPDQLARAAHHWLGLQAPARLMDLALSARPAQLPGRAPY